MYQAVLTRRYLTTKIMPVLAMIAVTLSVGTVLVTWSVMGGFLRTLLETGRTLIGDVAISWPNTGFAYYDDLIEMLEDAEGVVAAAPVIETFGLVSFADDRVQFAQLKGVSGDSFSRVTSFNDTIWWRPLEQPAAKDDDATDVRLQRESGYAGDDGRMVPWAWEQLETDGRSLTENASGDGATDGSTDGMTIGAAAAAVPGIHVSGWNRRTAAGTYEPNLPQQALATGEVRSVRQFLPHGSITMHVLPLDSTGRPRVDVVTRTLPVANEFFSGMFEVDSRVVLVRLDLLQSMLDMDPAERIVESTSGGVAVDPQTGELVFETRRVVAADPARVTTVLVRGAEGIDREALETLKREVTRVYQRFADERAGRVPAADTIQINTWRELNATTIAAVEKETGLVLFIFGLVCFTTVFLVLAIFWSMVSEKTRDIGILRALGAGTLGVAWLWLRYGAAIGIVGSASGVGAAWLVITNINEIHAWLGDAFNFVIWDPSVYYFTDIPTDMDWTKTTVVALTGVLTCLLGAALPAYRAGRMDPVKSLRFE